MGDAEFTMQKFNEGKTTNVAAENAQRVQLVGLEDNLGKPGVCGLMDLPRPQTTRRRTSFKIALLAWIQ